MLWVCIQLPQLALDDVQRRYPASSAPLALIAGSPQRRVIHAGNPAALRAGLYPNQPLAAARALLPEFRCFDYDPKAQEKLHRLLAAWAYGYTSMVSLREPDALLLEIGASLSLFESWPRLERQLRAELSELGITHRIAAAPTPLGACVLAGVQDGVAIDQSEPLRVALSHIALEQSRLPDEHILALRSMGLRRLRELYALPRDGLARRFDARLLDHLDRLRGDKPDPLPLYRPPDRFGSRIEFESEIESSEALLFPLHRLLGDLASYVRGRDGGVQRFEWVFEHIKFPATVAPIGLLTPQRDVATLLEVTRLTLQRLVFPAPILAIHLRANHLPPFVPAAADFFAQGGGAQMAWPQLSDRLRARLGEAALYQLEAVADHRPERAWRRSECPAKTRSGLAGTRPVWLLPKPFPLRDEPKRILAGPERIESGWWDGADIQRDYFVVQTRLGQRAWVFREANNGGAWMLHGWFA